MIDINKDDFEMIRAALAALIVHNGGGHIEFTEEILINAHRYATVEWEHDKERGVVKFTAPITRFVLEG